MPSDTTSSMEQSLASSVSMRRVFVPFSGYDTRYVFYMGLIKSPVTLSETLAVFLHWIVGGMILAADYSQLELRVLAHLSKDQRLLQVNGVDNKQTVNN